jgi:RNA polymerase sigma-70 factor (ECF subfamily)
VDSDEALFERLCGGDMAAFDVLYARLEAPLFGFIRARLGGDAAEAEDVMQEAFVAVLRERDRRTPVRNVRAWLYQVAQHICLNRARSRSRAGHAIDEARRIEPEAHAPVAERALEENERAQSLARAVEKLPTTLAELYHLRASGMSYEEVADATGVPIGTVKSRMHDLVRRLREEMP